MLQYLFIMMLFIQECDVQGKKVSERISRIRSIATEKRRALREKVNFIERRWVQIWQRYWPEIMVPPAFFKEEDKFSPNFVENIERLYPIFQNDYHVLRDILGIII